MKKLILATLILISGVTTASAQSNRIVFGPLVGDDAGVLTVHNGEVIEIELWVRTDPDNPTQIIGLTHALMSEDVIIAQRNGIDIEPEYGSPPDWEMWWIDGPYIYNPEDNYPIPEDWTCEIQVAICAWNPIGDCLDTQGEWDLYGTWLMDTNIDVPTGQVYFPFTEGWYPHSGQGTSWAFESPPGGSVEPEQDYSDLYVTSACIYIPGDCNHNGVPLELDDIMAVYSTYRGIAEPYYICDCDTDPPGPDFAATGDPNGNCISNELGDVVTEISAYRGLAEVSGCPDCPGG